MPPKIERKQLKDITVSAGEMLKFEGNIIGEPPADVTWKKESEVIETTTDKSIVITNVPYNTKLIIRSCKRYLKLGQAFKPYLKILPEI